jgi:hypothetical protein
MGEQLSVADVLERAADLLTPEGAWTQGAFARDEDGAPLLGSVDGAARCWCMVGAVIHAGNGQHFNKANDLLCDITEGTFSFNDEPSRTQAEVVAKLREAAALARAEGK